MTLEFLLNHTLPIASMIAVGALLLYLLPHYFRASVEQAVTPEPPMPLRPLLVRVLIWLLATRACLYLVSSVMAGGPTPSGAWIRWDANHYLGLAENWYVNQGDPRFHIVFYPLYPLLVRGLRLVFLDNTALAATVLSNICLFGAGWALFRLVEMEFGQYAASRALKYLMLCPLSLFFSIPYSESLFVLLTLLSVLMARRRNMALSILFGALAANTRLLGLLCAVPVFHAFLCIARERSEGDRKRFARGALVGVLCTCLIALGFLAYLWLNYSVTGDPLKFLEYQRDHWSQSFGSLYGSVRTTIQNLLVENDRGTLLGIWLPQIVSIFLVLALLCATAKRLNPGDGAYALLYFYIALAPTWLLSGPRYLAGMYALHPMLALVTGKKWQDCAMTALLALLSLYCVYAYAIEGALL